MADAMVGPDLSAVGNVAQASKKATGQPQDLVSFSVKKGDNGGVLICETYEKKAPAGRRASNFSGGGDYKENPFSPDDGAAAQSHINELLTQMGVSAPEPEAPPMEEPPMPAPPSMAAARGPFGGGVAMASGGDEGY